MKKSILYVVGLVVLALLIILLIIFFGNGGVNTKDIINNTSYIENKAIVELKTANEKLDNLIVSEDIIKEMKNNAKKYSMKLSEVLADKDISSKDLYNISKAIEEKIVTKDTTLKEYYAKITGFRNVNAFIKFCEESFENIRKENKEQS